MARNARTAGAKANRASFACSSCRGRKIRCDVSLHGSSPCNNCKLDGITCVVKPRKRRMRQPVQHRDGVHPDSFVFDSCSTSASTCTASPKTTLGTAWTSAFAAPLTLADCTFATPLTLADCTFGGEASVSPVNLQVQSQQSSSLTVTPTTSAQTSQPSPSSSSGVSFVFSNTDETLQSPLLDAQTSQSPSDSPDASFVFTNTDQTSQSPASSSAGTTFDATSCGIPWIEAWTGEHSDEDSQRQLRDAGCDAKLDAALVDKLLRLYFTYFHYRLPVLAEAEIHSIVTADQAAEGKSMSLAMLYAILYAASGVLDQQDATDAGFLAIPDAVTQFGARARLLHQMGCEPDALNNACISLLLVWSNPDPYTHSELYLTEAFRHIEPAYTSTSWYDLTARERRICNSWTLRASTVVMGMQKWDASHLIHSEGIRPLSMADFDEDVALDWFLPSATKTQLAQRFLALLEMAPVLHDMSTLATQRSLAGSPPLLNEVERLTAQLHRVWRQNQSLLDVSDCKTAEDEGQRAILLQKSYIGLVYNFADASLHRFNIGQRPQPTTCWEYAVAAASGQEVLDATTRSIEILQTLLPHNLVHCLPLTFILITSLAVSVQYIDTKYNTSLDTQSLRCLTTAVESLAAFQRRGYFAEFASALIDSTLVISDEIIFQARSESLINLLAFSGSEEGAASQASSSSPSSSAFTLLSSDTKAIYRVLSTVLKFQDDAIASGRIGLLGPYVAQSVNINSSALNPLPSQPVSAV